MALVIVVTPMLYPSRRTPPTAAPKDTGAAVPTAPGAAAALPAPSQAQPSPSSAISAAPGKGILPNPGTTGTGARAALPTSTVKLNTGRAQFLLVNPGAVPAEVRLPSYRDLTPAARRASPDSTVVVRTGSNMLGLRLARGADTIALDTVQFAVTQSQNGVTFASPAISISYLAVPDGYRTQVRATVANAPPGSRLLIDLPSSFESVEADTLDDVRHFAFGFKVPLRDVASVPFSKLDTTVRVDSGSFQWVSARSKYFIVALMQPIGEKPAGVFDNVVMRRGAIVNKLTKSAYATTTVPVTNGQIAFDLFVGPQDWQVLRGLGNDLENVNPYAGWLHAVVQPFSTICMRILLWMKATFRVSYGWVLVLFGVLIRLLLWPLNQKAMRTSIQMQRLQPELTELQKRYKSEPQKQQEAMMKLYQSHGMSPLSPMLGCLPMLLPMPVLYALYFVFQNTIEFRGVPFLWLPDLALRDPYFIIPVVMGLSMFLLSWIGMRAAPPNPQAKMMGYMMPVLFTVMFLNFSSGLNLYYAVQNIAALPQQWIITRERAKAGVVGTAPAKRPAVEGRRA